MNLFFAWDAYSSARRNRLFTMLRFLAFSLSLQGDTTNQHALTLLDQSCCNSSGSCIKGSGIIAANRTHTISNGAINAFIRIECNCILYFSHDRFYFWCWIQNCVKPGVINWPRITYRIYWSTSKVCIWQSQRALWKMVSMICLPIEFLKVMDPQCTFWSGLGCCLWEADAFDG